MHSAAASGHQASSRSSSRATTASIESGRSSALPTSSGDSDQRLQEQRVAAGFGRDRVHRGVAQRRAGGDGVQQRHGPRPASDRSQRQHMMVTIAPGRSPSRRRCRVTTSATTACTDAGRLAARSAGRGVVHQMRRSRRSARSAVSGRAAVRNSSTTSSSSRPRNRSSNSAVSGVVRQRQRRARCRAAASRAAAQDSVGRDPLLQSCRTPARAGSSRCAPRADRAATAGTRSTAVSDSYVAAGPLTTTSSAADRSILLDSRDLPMPGSPTISTTSLPAPSRRRSPRQHRQLGLAADEGRSHAVGRSCASSPVRVPPTAADAALRSASPCPSPGKAGRLPRSNWLRGPLDHRRGDQHLA